MNNFAYDNCEKRSQRLVRFIPNALTICNSLFGFAAMLYMLKAHDRGLSYDETLGFCAVSSWLIFSAMVFDAFDGFAARLLNASSMHGIQMDSLSDMVTFGVAPAMMVAIISPRLIGEVSKEYEIIIYLLSSVYLGCAALRLATYNVYAIIQKKSSGNFSGLPSPGAAAALCVTVLFMRGSYLDIQKLGYALPVYAMILGLLMTSNVQYLHFGKWVQSARRSRLRFLILLILLGAVAIWGIDALMIEVTGYVLSGPVTGFFRLLHSHCGSNQTL